MQVPRTRADLVLRLFDDFYERVYAFLRKSTAPEVAEDLAQEVFVRLLQHPELERLTISVSYLLKIAHNLLRRRYARAARLRELLQERQQERQQELGGDGLSGLGGAIALDSNLLEAAMGLLSSDEHSAVRLIVCEGRSYQHAAESLGVTVTTINNWKHRGLGKLRRYLAEADRGDFAGHHARPEVSTGGLHDDLRREIHNEDRGPTMVETAHRARKLAPRRPGWCAASDDVA
jgi:RNA polymerase sigma factor (sigma-70 family)